MMLSRDADVWLRFWSWWLFEILEMKFDQDLCLNLYMTYSGYFGKLNSTLGSVVPLAMYSFDREYLSLYQSTIFVLISQFHKKVNVMILMMKMRKLMCYFGIKNVLTTRPNSSQYPKYPRYPTRPVPK